MENLLKLINKLNIKRDIFLIAVMIIWIMFTILSPAMTSFNTDEFWAYSIAEDLNFFEIIKLMHYEGHTFIWYLVLKPFTYFESLFPMVIKWINWGFMFLALILFCKLSPINNFIKALIILSSPFLIIYPSLGRMYGLTIFLMFILTIFYKHRLKNPLLYAIIIFITTNTCLNGAIFTFILSCFFIFDLYKSDNKILSNKKNIAALIIVVLSFVSLCIQWIPIHSPTYFAYDSKFRLMKDFFFPYGSSKILKFISFLIYFPLFQVVLYIFCKELKEVRWKIYSFYIVNTMLFSYSFLAIPRYYLLYFFYVFLIILYWLLLENCSNFKDNKRLYIACSVFVIAISLLFNALSRPTRFWYTDKDIYNSAIEQVKTYVPQNSTIYLVTDLSQGFIHPLKNKYNLRSTANDPIPSYTAYKNIYLYKYIPPYEMKNIDKNSYYIVSQQYISIYRKKPLKKYNCATLSGDYYLCKLPIQKQITLNKEFLAFKNDKNYRENIRTFNIINNFVPENSSIYLEPNIYKKLKPYLQTSYKVKLMKDNYNYHSNAYALFEKYHIRRSYGNCISINNNYLLCKYVK